MGFERCCLNLGFCCLAAAAAWRDGKERRLPDGLVKALAVLGLAARVWKVLEGSEDGLGVLGEGALGALAGAGIFLFLLLIWPGAFGGGDVKFLAAGGIFLGPAGTVVAFVFGVLLAGVFCVARCRAAAGTAGRKSRLDLFLRRGWGSPAGGERRCGGGMWGRTGRASRHSQNPPLTGLICCLRSRFCSLSGSVGTVFEENLEMVFLL